MSSTDDKPSSGVKAPKANDSAAACEQKKSYAKRVYSWVAKRLKSERFLPLLLDFLLLGATSTYAYFAYWQMVATTEQVAKMKDSLDATNTLITETRRQADAAQSSVAAALKSNDLTLQSLRVSQRASLRIDIGAPDGPIMSEHSNVFRVNVVNTGHMLAEVATPLMLTHGVLHPGEAEPQFRKWEDCSEAYSGGVIPPGRTMEWRSIDPSFNADEARMIEHPNPKGLPLLYVYGNYLYWDGFECRLGSFCQTYVEISARKAGNTGMGSCTFKTRPGLQEIVEPAERCGRGEKTPAEESHTEEIYQCLRNQQVK